jgi:hypothetical protein
VRDFLYARMRGVKEPATSHADHAKSRSAERPGDAELAATLREVTQELRGIRLALESQTQPGNSNDV